MTKAGRSPGNHRSGMRGGEREGGARWNRGGRGMGRGRGREETGRSKEQDVVVYITKKLPVSDSGEPVLPIIAAPRRPRDSPSSSHATRTSSDRPGPARCTCSCSYTPFISYGRSSHTRASLPVPPSLSIQPGAEASFSRPLVPVLSLGLGSLFSSGLNTFRVRSSSSSSSSLLERVS